MALDFNKINRAAAFNPISAFPLDARGYFESYDAALEAAKKAKPAGDTTTLYHYGLHIVVVENNEAKFYIIQPPRIEGDLPYLKELSSGGESAKIVLDERCLGYSLDGEVQLKDFGTEYYRYNIIDIEKVKAEPYTNTITIGCQWKGDRYEGTYPVSAPDKEFEAESFEVVALDNNMAKYTVESYGDDNYSITITLLPELPSTDILAYIAINATYRFTYKPNYKKYVNYCYKDKAYWYQCILNDDGKTYSAKVLNDAIYYFKVDGFISGLEQKTIVENGQLVTAWFEPNSTTVEGLSSQISTLSATVQNLSLTVDGYDSKILKIENDVSTVVNKMSNVEAVVSGMETRVTAVETAITQHSDDISDIKNILSWEDMEIL